MSTQKFILPVLVLMTVGSYAATGIASTGNWSQSSTWNFNGTNRVPDCGDTLMIPVSTTVTLTTMENYYSCTEGMLILVQGSFQLIDGFKLRLPCGSSVVLLPGGEVRKSTPGGGNSTFIHICHCDAWTASEGAVGGPAILACSVLPVTLTTFEANYSSNGVGLKWSTASEVNNNFFRIERSADAENFEKVGIVNGNGTTDIRNDYSFTDDSPLIGISYYRLAQTDYDGTVSYSDIVAVNNKTKGLAVESYYSVMENTIHATVICPTVCECTVQLINAYGTMVSQKKTDCTSNVMKIDFNTVVSGTYLVRATTETASFVSRIVIP